MSTLTFVYEDSTAVLGPLSRSSEPHAYDLCRDHATRLTAPRGWELLRVEGGSEATDDLVALADAVRPGRPATPESPVSARGTDHLGPAAAPRRTGTAPSPDLAPGRHLHVLRSPHD